MRIPRWLTGLVILGLLLGSVASIGAAAGQGSERVRVLIGFARQPGSAEQALVRGVGGTIRYTYHLVPAIAATVPEGAIDGLRRNPNVTSVDLDGLVWAIDTELDNSWGVKRIGAGTVHVGGNKGTGVKVAIIDSGIDYTHPDLNDNFAGGYDFVQGDNDPMDVYGHGTHVAGTACAEDNGFGVVGVAPNCTLYSLRVLNDIGVGSWSDIIAAMQWAVDKGMQVANLSLGSSLNPGGTVKAAFDNAEAAGLLIAAAAGNDGNPPGKGNNVTYPARYDSVIAVAATDSNDKRASWSSTGDQVELTAPGVAVFSTWNDSDSPHDPQPVCDAIEGCYKYGSGTSMASPHVAGTAALVLAANPGWTNDQVRTRLQVTADDLGNPGRDPQYGFGLVDADEAAALTPPTTLVSIAVTPTSASIFVGGTQQFTAMGTFSDDSTADLTSTATWASSNTSVATIAAGGLATGVAAGTATITATQDGVLSNGASLTVTEPPPPSGMTVTAIDPNTMQSGTTIDVRIAGSGFASAADVTFENGNGPAPIASNVKVIDASTITATVMAKSGGPPRPRVWDVRVTNLDGSSGVLVEGFTVTP